MMHPRQPYQGSVGNGVIALVVVVSVLMLFVGAMLMHITPQFTNKKYDDDESGFDQREADQRTAVSVTTAGRIVADIGAFLLIIILLLAAVLRSDWSEYVRFGVLFFAAVFAFSLGFRL